MRTGQCAIMFTSAAMLLIAGMATPAGAAVLSVTVDTAPNTTLDLTNEGTLDWIQLGRLNDTDINQKLGAAYLSPVVRHNARNARWDTTDYQSSWTDGDPTLSDSNITTTWEAKSPAGADTTLTSFTFDVSNLTVNNGQLIVYATAYYCIGKLTAEIGGASQNASFNYSTNNHASFTIDFDLAAGETLDITFAQTADTGANQDDNIGISAITLVPEPATIFIMLTAGLPALLKRRKR